MKTICCLALFFLSIAIMCAQTTNPSTGYLIVGGVGQPRTETNNLITLLQQGLVEEQVNRNLDAAVADYQQLLQQFDKDRPLAATAIFRLGECYRLQGRTNEAVAAYRRIVSEFSDQSAVIQLSRQTLASWGAVVESPAATSAASDPEAEALRHAQDIVQNSPDLINSPDGNNNLLYQAVTRGQLRVATFLLDHGANINQTTGGYTPFEMAVQNNEKPLIELLLGRGADINVHNGTPLLTATGAGHLSLVEFLLAHKADINVHRGDPDGSTPLHGAVWKGYVNLVSLLLANGADVNATNTSGQTALHLVPTSTNGNQIKILQLLFEHHANPNLKDNEGKSPLDRLDDKVARLSGWPGYDFQKSLDKEMADLLRQHGALDRLPNWDRISVSRPADRFTGTIFRKGTNDWNQFSLLELIAVQYQFLAGSLGERRERSRIDLVSINDHRGPAALAFPELSQIRIHRPDPGSTNSQTLAVDLTAVLGSGDCSKDVALHWGDVVEIPATKHEWGENWNGFSHRAVSNLTECLTRHVQLVVTGQVTSIPLTLEIDQAGQFFTKAPFLIGPVLWKANVTAEAFDLSHVKVTRNDAATGKKQEWTIDCSNPSHPSDLWMRDGDVIEVSKKR